MDCSDFEKHTEYMISYFNDKDPDDEFDDFMAKLRQQHNKKTNVLRQRFDTSAQRLIEKGLLTSYAVDSDGCMRPQAEYFFVKSNENAKEFVRKKMKSEGNKIAECNIEQLFGWAREYEKSEKFKGNNTSASMVVRKKQPNGRGKQGD